MKWSVDAQSSTGERLQEVFPTLWAAVAAARRLAAEALSRGHRLLVGGTPSVTAVYAVIDDRTGDTVTWIEVTGGTPAAEEVQSGH